GRIASQRVLERVEANVPAGAVARRLADLVDRIDQRENRSGLGRHDLEPNAIGAPPDFEQAGRLERQNLALVAGQAMPRLELKWGANLPFVHDYLVGKPLTELIRLRQGLPDLGRRMRQFAHEPKLPGFTDLL